MIPVLDVYCSGLEAHQDVYVGRCRFNLKRGKISSTFSYADSFLGRTDSFVIDPALPLRATSYHCDGLPGALRDSAPDRWGRHLIGRRILCEKKKTPRTLDEVDYLLGVHDVTRQGSLRFRTPESDEFLSPEQGVPPIVELKRLIAASNQIAIGAEGLQLVKELLDAGSGSLGGARPKASVLDEGKILLAKFSHPGDEWDVMAWEKVALDIACRAGLHVPSAALHRIGNDRALVIERFDRENSQYEGMRIPYLSAMSLIGGSDGGQYDYLDIAESLAVIVAHPQTALHELFARAALSVALHNTDDHLRNIGLVFKDGGWMLAPVFDVNINPDSARWRATAIYGEVGADEVHALKEFSEACGLDLDEARETVKKVVEASEKLPQIAKANKCSQAEIGIMWAVVCERCTALRAAFGL